MAGRNLIKNGDFKEGLKYWKVAHGSPTVEDDVLILREQYYIWQSLNLPPGHYYLGAKYKHVEPSPTPGFQYALWRVNTYSKGGFEKHGFFTYDGKYGFEYYKNNPPVKLVYHKAIGDGWFEILVEFESKLGIEDVWVDGDLGVNHVDYVYLGTKLSIIPVALPLIVGTLTFASASMRKALYPK